jgi:hypothetical protein
VEAGGTTRTIAVYGCTGCVLADALAKGGKAFCDAVLTLKQ